MQRRGPESRLCDLPLSGGSAVAAGGVVVIGRCRVCQCTDLTPCQDNGDGVPCSWLDRAHTLCDNIECIAQIPLAVLEQLLEERMN